MHRGRMTKSWRRKRSSLTMKKKSWLGRNVGRISAVRMGKRAQILPMLRQRVIGRLAGRDSSSDAHTGRAAEALGLNKDTDCIKAEARRPQ